ncbi:hypothetical protein TNIN_481501 [Trichonephila inaurata madagascariensis]|uniref:Uncharacterized protein n=1 Tax=Trichonephila inaurata madagascariensis TaxID=2747483 RepID=A0A8X7BQF1_9ARAC|nr:hypothetical protein TNIN_481501 [Trichonephila inaurata madagascariensis]
MKSSFLQIKKTAVKEHKHEILQHEPRTSFLRYPQISSVIVSYGSLILLSHDVLRFRSMASNESDRDIDVIHFLRSVSILQKEKNILFLTRFRFHNL